MAVLNDNSGSKETVKVDMPTLGRSVYTTNKPENDFTLKNRHKVIQSDLQKIHQKMPLIISCFKCSQVQIEYDIIV